MRHSPVRHGRPNSSLYRSNRRGYSPVRRGSNEYFPAGRRRSPPFDQDVDIVIERERRPRRRSRDRHLNPVVISKEIESDESSRRRRDTSADHYEYLRRGGSALTEHPPSRDTVTEREDQELIRLERERRLSAVAENIKQRERLERDHRDHRETLIEHERALIKKDLEIQRVEERRNRERQSAVFEQEARPGGFQVRYDSYHKRPIHSHPALEQAQSEAAGHDGREYERANTLRGTKRK